MTCQWITVGPDKTRDGRYVHRRCRRPATATTERVVAHPQGDYTVVTHFCDRHLPKGKGPAM